MPRKKNAESKPESTEPDRVKSSRTLLAQQAFLAAFIENNGNVTRASEAAGVLRQTFYDWKKNDPQFVEQLREVDEIFADSLEAAARDFAFEGDTTLLIFLLKSLRRSKYDDQVARIKWQHDNQLGDPNAFNPPNIVFVEDRPDAVGDEPEPPAPEHEH